MVGTGRQNSPGLTCERSVVARQSLYVAPSPIHDLEHHLLPPKGVCARVCVCVCVEGVGEGDALYEGVDVMRYMYMYNVCACVHVCVCGCVVVWEGVKV